MAQESADQEPTMEEILASIRRIINEDDDAKPEAKAAPEPQAVELAPAPEPEPAQADEDDVLELTDRVEDDAMSGGTAPMAIADDLMIVDREDEPAPEPEPEPEPAPAPAAAAPRPAPAPEPAREADEDSLLDAAPASLAAGMFAALSDNLRVSSEQGQTLEGIVREMMRPMLKKWLDDNLPAIVEEKVQAEVERIARRRR
jgi:uncharacterized protein